MRDRTHSANLSMSPAGGELLARPADEDSFLQIWIRALQSAAACGRARVNMAASSLIDGGA
jgi:hypothetical protein